MIISRAQLTAFFFADTRKLFQLNISSCERKDALELIALLIKWSLFSLKTQKLFYELLERDLWIINHIYLYTFFITKILFTKK